MTDEQRKLLEEARSVANDRNYDIQRLVRYMLHRLIDIINEQELTIQELKSSRGDLFHWIAQSGHGGASN